MNFSKIKKLDTLTKFLLVAAVTLALGYASYDILSAATAKSDTYAGDCNADAQGFCQE